jgi:anti-anti-sigma factor
MSEVIRSNGRLTIRPDVDVVSSTADDFREEVLNLINQNNCEIVIDLEGVDEIDSFGIGVFIATYNALLKKEKKFLITNASHPIFALLHTMGLTRRFEVLPRNPAPQIS